MTHKLKVSFKGFTLIELIVVIGIIAILAAIVIVAVNPARQFANARNAQRSNDVLAMLDGIYQEAADNSGGTLNAAITSVINFPAAAVTTRNVCSAVVVTLADPCYNNNVATPNGVNLATGAPQAASFLVPNYLSAIPKDPSQAAGNDTGYDITVDKTSTTKITVLAPLNENGKTITVTR